MSIWKNIITFGRHGKLKSEVKDFELTVENYRRIEDAYLNICNERLRAFLYLQYEREDAKRNFTLMRNLISRVKEVGSKNSIELTDSIAVIDQKYYMQAVTNFSVDFDRSYQVFSDTVSTSFNSSLRRLEDKNSKNKKITKEDLIEEGVVFAIDSIISGIEQIINLNSEVNEKRAQIVEETRKVQKALDKILSSYNDVSAEANRILEIANVLNINNKAFTTFYVEINNLLNVKPFFSRFIQDFLNVKIIPSDDVNDKLAMLLTVCSDYNKINLNTIMK
jgi:hypothetical protein